jgi:hypothetical protein
VTLCAKCRLARIVTLVTETVRGTELHSNNQTLSNGPLPRKLHWLESVRDGLPHAASHRHLAQGVRELMAEEVSLRFLGFADPRVAPLSGFVPGGCVPALERRWVAIDVVDRMPRRRASRTSGPRLIVKQPEWQATPPNKSDPRQWARGSAGHATECDRGSFTLPGARALSTRQTALANTIPPHVTETCICALVPAALPSQRWLLWLFA